MRKAISLCTCFQALGDARTAQALQRVLEEQNAHLKVLVQVKDETDPRHGVPIPQLLKFLNKLAENSRLQVTGLMTLASPDLDNVALRRHFARVRRSGELATSQLLLPSRPILSMGMSSDYQLAIAEGATLVRLGRALFPPLNPS